jgi:hypothetical protein
MSKALAVRNATEEVYYGAVDAITASIYLDDAAATATTATASLYDSGNNLVRSPAVTIAAGSLSIATTANDFDTAERGCSVRWVVTASLANYNFQTLFDAVKHKAPCPITGLDLLAFYPDLNSQLPSGTTTWNTQIQAAFAEVKDDIWTRGYRGNTVLEPRQLKRLTTEKALAVIMGSFARTPDSIWAVRAAGHEAKYQRLLGSERLWFDTDQDGARDADSSAFGTISLVR